MIGCFYQVLCYRVDFLVNNDSYTELINRLTKQIQPTLVPRAADLRSLASTERTQGGDRICTIRIYNYQRVPARDRSSSLVNEPKHESLAIS